MWAKKNYLGCLECSCPVAVLVWLSHRAIEISSWKLLIHIKI